jgi:preprotein translocase subunit SecE
MTEEQPEKKVGFVARTKKSAKATLNELKKVHWPTKKELITYTEVVLVAVVVIAAAIWVVDSIIAGLFGLVF